MVLEIFAEAMGKRPRLRFFLVGLLYFSVAFVISLGLFDSNRGLYAVFLTILGGVHFVYNSMKREESYDVHNWKEKKLLAYHYETIMNLLMFFLGITLAVTVWVVALPGNVVAESFVAQTNAISEINPGLADGVLSLSGNATSAGDLFEILAGNFVVLFVCVLFSFIYGLGAIYVITWNASVIGLAIGTMIKKELMVLSSNGLTEALQVMGAALARFSLHAIPEILAFIVAGMAGGIISVSIARNHLLTEKGTRIIYDASSLLMISVGLLIIAGIIEVYVTPVAYSLF